MQIHSDFRDYYDKAIGFGIDKKVHYNRFTKKADIRIDLKLDLPREIGTYLIGFCGYIYPGYKLNKLCGKYDRETGHSIYRTVESFFAYSFEELEEKKDEWDRSKDCHGSVGYGDHSRLRALKQFFFEWSVQSDATFIENKVPIWVLRLDHLEGTLNPILKDFGFERLKDPLTAFQDISVYLSNILVEQKEIATVEDKYKIEQQGFDSKLSFRKGKEKS